MSEAYQCLHHGPGPESHQTSGDDPPAALPDDLLSGDVEKVLTREMESLTFVDRTRVQEEVHGVANLCPTEAPAMVDNALKAMQQHLDIIPHKTIYNKISPKSYLHSRDWRLRFLRCELFDAKKAAERLVTFTNNMIEQYDMEVLERPLRLSDLKLKSGSRGKEVMESFKSGHVQLLPFRDRSGRRIFAFHNKSLVHDAEIRYKVYQYLMLVASEDEETQRNGVVIVVWGRNVPSSVIVDSKEHLRSHKALSGLPIRIAAIHQAFEDNAFGKIGTTVLKLMMKGAANKIRLQTHPEQDWELKYKLLGYGIPVDLLPYTDSDNIKTKNLHVWMKGRYFIEQAEQDMHSNLVDCPALTDVVFKKGTPNISHPGNYTFREILQSYSAELSTLSSAAKQTVVTSIIDHVFRKGGRFLEWSDDGCWVVIRDDPQIRKKVYNSLMSSRKIEKAKMQVQSITSGTLMFERQDGRKRKRLSLDDDESMNCWINCGSVNQ